jgi:hypothetical protein
VLELQVGELRRGQRRVDDIVALGDLVVADDQLVVGSRLDGSGLDRSGLLGDSLDGGRGDDLLDDSGRLDDGSASAVPASTSPSVLPSSNASASALVSRSATTSAGAAEAANRP